MLDNLEVRAWWPDEKKMEHGIEGDLGQYLYNGTDLMERTSIKDKEIWQGDIIRYDFEHPITGNWEKHLGVIAKDAYGFTVESLSGDCEFPLRDLADVMDDVKAVGNICENPEMLQEGGMDSVISKK